MSEFRGAEPQLVWLNKDKHLLARGPGDYEWVDATDPRVSEIRRFRVVGTFGQNPHDNLLILGDARHALGALAGQPEFAQRYVGQVKLAYIDPPFNTGNTYRHYRDRVQQSVWLTVLRDSLAQMKSLLSEDGSVWVHLDNNEQHRAREVLEEVFGPDNFVATVIWERTNTPRMTASPFAIRHDYIHVYRKSPKFTVHRLTSGVDNPPRRADALWRFDEAGSAREGSAESRRLFNEPFATPKPERLLAQVLALATDPGDIVLDCFAGSGTTAAVAHKLGRRWVSVEVLEDTVCNFLQQRLVKVVNGTDDAGISKDIDWSGGGGFTRLDVEPSRFEQTSTTEARAREITVARRPQVRSGVPGTIDYPTDRAASATDRTLRPDQRRPVSAKPDRSAMRWRAVFSGPNSRTEPAGVTSAADAFCGRCGRRFEDDARFCGGCGARRGG